MAASTAESEIADSFPALRRDDIRRDRSRKGHAQPEATCLALILGATLWFVTARSQPSGADTALDNAQAPTVTPVSLRRRGCGWSEAGQSPAPEAADPIDLSTTE